MQMNDAVELIKHDSIFKSGEQDWADLGCGSGTFTMALASLLALDSTIYAVDKNKYSLD